MAATGYTPISLYYSTTAAAVPVNTNLVNGELALNITDGKLYYKDNTGTVKVLAGAGGAGVAGGSNTQVQYNSSGSLAGSANMTFNGTTLSVAGLSDSGNLTFTGTANRITGDMSNATVSNRVTIQTSTANSTTSLNLAPSGTGTGVRLDSFAGSDVDNSAYMRIGHNGTSGYLSTSYYGTGANTPMAFFTAGSERLRIDTSGNVGIGTTAPNKILEVFAAGTTAITGIFGSTTGALATLNYTSIPGIQGYTTTGASATQSITLQPAGGNVGVGTATPGYLLDVSTSQNGVTAARVQNVNTGGSAYSAFYFANDVNSAAAAGFFTTSSTNNTFGGPNTFNIWTQSGTMPIVFTPNGTEAARITTAGLVGVGTTTPTTKLQVVGSSSVAAFKTPNIVEVATVSATAATGTINYDCTTQSVVYYTTNASGNWTINFRGSSGTSLNTVMATGESMSFSFLATQGSTAYYNSAVQVDGTTSGVTTKWQGGTAPTSGNASSIDSYTYVIIKTGSATFTVLATQTKFA